MRRELTALIAALGCSVVCLGQTNIFFDGFETADTSAWWAPARVGETGQVTCYDVPGAVTPCADTGQDGDIRGGVAWPNPRFVDNGDGTVTDTLTNLIWLKNSNCFGTRTWANALADANALANGTCDLTDGSTAGDWHLPSILELVSLTDLEYTYPSLSNTAGTAQWAAGDPFTNVTQRYWSSTSDADGASYAYYFYAAQGNAYPDAKTTPLAVWPVRSAGAGAWAPARVRATGQVTCYTVAGVATPCSNTGQDGDVRAGVAWPSPRFVDNGDGTATDMLTGLIWLKDANCTSFGAVTWQTALTDAATLADGTCGLSDGSAAGDWRLPSFAELRSLVDYEYTYPAVSNGAGTGKWSAGDVFSHVQNGFYWSSSSYPVDLYPGFTREVRMVFGTDAGGDKTATNYVWPVRGVR